MKDRIPGISVPASATIRQAMLVIDRGAIGTAFVVNEERVLVGLVTDGDLRRALLAGLGLESPLTLLHLKRPITARQGLSMDEIAGLFSEPVRVVPIVDDAGRAVDIALFDKRAHLPVAQPILGEKELTYVSECVLTGWVSSTGKFVTRFEEAFGEFCCVPYAVSAANGTVALHLALIALGIGPGDEVIVPTLTFVASANTVVYTGAKPVFVDSHPKTWNLDPNAVEAAITPRTKAIMAVHLYGHPADMDALKDICERHNLKLIEDAAEAHGACYNGMRVGSFGDVSCFSFYGNKIVTTGEGGMIVTPHREIAEKCRILRDHGMSPERRYWHPVLGYNYRMTNLQAALGVAQMERIDGILEAKRRIAEQYHKALAGIPGIEPLVEPPKAWSVYWLYSILVDEARLGMNRDALSAFLKERGVDTRPVFPVLHKQPIYMTGQSLPVAEDISARGLSLPSDPTLNASEIAHIAKALREAAQQPAHARS